MLAKWKLIGFFGLVFTAMTFAEQASPQHGAGATASDVRQAPVAAPVEVPSKNLASGIDLCVTRPGSPKSSELVGPPAPADTRTH